MLRKRAAHQKKVDSAVRVLQTTTGVNVPMAMILAGFSKSDIIADEIVRQQVQRRLTLMGSVTNNNQREVIFVDDDSAIAVRLYLRQRCIAAYYNVGIVILRPDKPQAEKKADQANCICCPTTSR
jgi:hypothetical protein